MIVQNGVYAAFYETICLYHPCLSLCCDLFLSLCLYLAPYLSPYLALCLCLCLCADHAPCLVASLENGGPCPCLCVYARLICYGVYYVCCYCDACLKNACAALRTRSECLHLFLCLSLCLCRECRSLAVVLCKRMRL